MFCVFLSYSTESTHYLTFIGVLGCFPAKESWREHVWCLRQLHSLSPWKRARRGARVVAPDPIFRYLGVALPPPISGAAWGRRRRSQQPIWWFHSNRQLFGQNTRVRGLQPVGGGCWAKFRPCSKYMASGLYISRYKPPPYAMDMLCLYCTTGLETRFRNCTALRLDRRQCV